MTDASPTDLIRPEAQFRVALATPEATRALAEKLAPRLLAGDILALSGPIGAGKSFFARALIQTRLAALGLEEDIPSPTFTLVQTYQAGKLEIWHSDLYRLSTADEVFELGLDEAFDSALCLIEWPERLGTDLPDSALHLHFADGKTENSRVLSLSSRNHDWLARLSRLFLARGRQDA